MSNSNINNSSHDDEKGNSRSKGSSTSSPFDIFLKTNNNKNKNNTDCDRPACEDTVSALSNALNRLKNQKITDNPNSRDSKKKECPPSKDSIGRSSWTLLHSMVCLSICIILVLLVLFDMYIVFSSGLVNVNYLILLYVLCLQFISFICAKQAAWYPDKPSLEEEQKMTQFMEALSIFYPCTYCADDFQMNLKLSPVK